MKFLHTGDWHLGKIFYAQSLIEDQKHILNQIIEILLQAEKNKEPYQVLCIPGDIYDRAIPNSDATVLLNNFLNKINAEVPNISILILSGNHDSSKRLGFASSFLEKSRIYICSSSEHIEIPVVIGRTCFYQIPFINNVKFTAENNLSQYSQNEVYKQCCFKILEAHNKNYPGNVAILCTHATCFNTGDEYYSVGTAEKVDPEVFHGFDYVALGHIHKMMCIKKQSPCIWYSGSPIAYSFDDIGKKGVLSVEIDEETHKAQVEQIFLTPLHPIKRLSGSFSELDDADEASKWSNCYIEAECNDEKTMNNPIEILAKRYPHILSFKYAKKNRSGKSVLLEKRKEAVSGIKNDQESMSKVFELFIKDLYGNKLEEKHFTKEKAVFDEILREIELEKE